MCVTDFSIIMVCYIKKAIHPYPEFRTVSLFSSSFPCGSKIYPFIFKICLSSLWLRHNHEMKTLGSQSFYTDWGTESKWFKEFRDGVKPWASSVEVTAQSLWARSPCARIHCFGEHLISSPGGVVLVIFSALGNWVSNLRLKSSRLSYSFPR